MTHLQAIGLGLLQGVTEFLPVSSSGHLVLLEHFWQVEGAGLSFDAFLHLGTLLAVLLYFAADWREMLLGRDRGARRLLVFVAAATVPGAAVGFLLEGAVAERFRSPEVVALMLAVMSVPLLLAELLGRGRLPLSALTWPRALGIGLAQSLAVIPGTSRSGITMACGLLLGLTREDAARFSFLLSAPIIAGAGAYEALKALHHAGGVSPAYLSGLAASFLSGYAVIVWLLRFLREHSFYPFVVYRLALAGVVYALA